MNWELNKTVQCEKCPWKKNTNPLEIPNGYSIEKHKALKKTIGNDSIEFIKKNELHVMGCHENHDDYCIGWLKNQLGIGNNILLRIKMVNCTNVNLIKTIGKQHKKFEDTIPKE